MQNAEWGGTHVPPVLHSSFCIHPFFLALARTRTWNPTFEASRDVRFHHEGAPRARRLSAPPWRNRSNKKPRGPAGHRGPVAEKSAEPRHPAPSRRSLRSAQRSSAELEQVSDRRDSVRVAREAAVCRDGVNMVSRTSTVALANESTICIGN